MAPPVRKPRRRAGFTLLELMAVLLILGILMAFFVTGGMGLLSDAKSKEARQNLHALTAHLLAYRSRMGDYPSDRLPPGTSDNGLNAAAEALYLALFDAKYDGEPPDESWLVNTDGDATSKSLTRLPDRSLFEIGDPWGNPVAYFDFRNYAVAEASLLAGAESEVAEQKLRPAKNPTTGNWYEPNGFQLISAGEDGEFGTEDDIANYSR